MRKTLVTLLGCVLGVIQLVLVVNEVYWAAALMDMVLSLLLRTTGWAGRNG
jgi:hypothetical protein